MALNGEEGIESDYQGTKRIGYNCRALKKLKEWNLYPYIGNMFISVSILIYFIYLLLNCPVFLNERVEANFVIYFLEKFLV